MRPNGNPIQNALLRAIIAIAGLDSSDREKPIVIVELATSTDWASATFIGATHHLALRLEGEPVAVAAAAERLRMGIDQDITVPGQIVAETETLLAETRVIADHIVSKCLTVNVLTIRD